MRVPGLPPVGGDVVASAVDLLPGGGFNVMAAAARAGAPVVYIGGYGAGRFGDMVRAAPAAEGIVAALPAAVEGDTGVCVVLVDDVGERTFVTGSGVETAVDPAALAAVPVTSADLVYVSGYSVLVETRGRALLDRLLDGADVLVDPGPLAGQVDSPVWDRLLARTTLLSASACDRRRGRLGEQVHRERVDDGCCCPRPPARPAGARTVVACVNRHRPGFADRGDAYTRGMSGTATTAACNRLIRRGSIRRSVGRARRGRGPGRRAGSASPGRGGLPRRATRGGCCGRRGARARR